MTNFHADRNIFPGTWLIGFEEPTDCQSWKKKAKKMSVNKRVYFTVKRSRKGPPSDSFTYLSFHAPRVPPFPPFHSSHLFPNALFIHIYITMTNRELLQKINELLLPLPASSTLIPITFISLECTHFWKHCKLLLRNALTRCSNTKHWNGLEK